MEDRRQYYRIKDRISLNYRVVQETSAEEEINLALKGHAELAELRKTLFSVDARLDDICVELKREFPLIAELTALINKKIALHERMMGHEEYEDHLMIPAREVSLSASGVAFEAETPLVEGSHLRLEIITYPENHYIPLYGKVVSCRKHNRDKASGFTIAVEFEAISEKDRERIMFHVFAKQAADLKKQREGQVIQAVESETSMIK